MRGTVRPRRLGVGSLLLALAAIAGSIPSWAAPAAAQEDARATRADSVAVLLAAFRAYENPDEHPLRLADAFCGGGSRGCAGSLPEAGTTRARGLLSRVADSSGVALAPARPLVRPPCPWGETANREDAGLIVGLSPPGFAGDSARVAVSRHCWRYRWERRARYGSGTTFRLEKAGGRWTVVGVIIKWAT